MSGDDGVFRKVEFLYTGEVRGMMDHAGYCCMNFSFEKGVDPNGPNGGAFLEIVIESHGGAELVADVDGAKIERPKRIRLRFASRDERRAALRFFKFMISILEQPECD